MLVNTNNLISMTEANQNFSKVVRIVDESGMAVILKNNKPKYILVDFNEYEEIQAMMKEKARLISETADLLINENLEEFKDLTK